MTAPMNYTQQQHAYLQAWRQVLEPLMPMPQAMLHPGGAWPMPAMLPYPQSVPPAPPGIPTTPPMAPDYAQQLFRYLQAWRQHLEMMLGTPPLPAQPSGGQPYDTAPPADPSSSTPAGSGGSGYGWPNVPSPPENPSAGKRSGPTGVDTAVRVAIRVVIRVRRSRRSSMRSAPSARRAVNSPLTCLRQRRIRSGCPSSPSFQA